MKYKLIVLDLDGTLLDDSKQISSDNYEALANAANSGVYIVPSTGRFYGGMPENVRSLPFVRYVITVNGAEVYDAKEKRVLSREEIPCQAGLRIFETLDTLPVIYDCFQNGWGWMERRFYDRIDEFITAPTTNRMVKTTRTPVDNLQKEMAARGGSFQKIQMFFQDMDRRKLELTRLQQLFPDMAVSSSIVNNIEINSGAANKGTALRFLCSHLGIDITETLAFGDGINDISMLKTAGLGIAMGNADDEVKRAAGFIAETNTNSGVAKALAKLLTE